MLHVRASKIGIVALTVVALVSIAWLASPPRLEAQGPWPYLQCKASDDVSCPDCNSTYTPKFGCTAPVPNTWTIGTCVEDGPRPCETWTPYSCGSEIVCGFFTPTGRPCPTVNLCRNVNP